MDVRSVYSAVGKTEYLSGVSRRVAGITVSAIKQMPYLASTLGGCVSLGQGIPSLNTPDFIREGVVDLLRRDDRVCKYSLQPGIPELKEEIVRSLKGTKGVDVDPDGEVFVSCGGMEALAASIATLINPGDEVILPTPNYSSHIEQVLFSEGRPVFVPLIEERGWKLDVEAIHRAITPKTRLIVLCNPANPTGAVLDEEDIRGIGDLALRHGLFILSDETYDFLLYDGQEHYSFLSFPNIRSRVIAVYSFSKAYCMTGWRVGYMVAPKNIIDQVLKVHDAFAICAPTISQYAALIALRETNGIDGEGDKSIRKLCMLLAERRSLVCEQLSQLPGLFSYQKPQGAYYIFPLIKDLGYTSMEFALALLHEAKVVTIPGSGFGPTGEGHIRMSFAGEDCDIIEAFRRIRVWWNEKKESLLE